MAEQSGFFQAQWDETLVDPTTGEATGWWDRSYIAQQFANYFKLFIGNGVFGSPTNQLKVIPGTGLNVIVTTGWAFINGWWYYNDSNKTIAITANSGADSRTDSIRVRFSNSNREITALGFTGDTTLVRGDTVYDLELAQVVVPPNAVSISASNITDRRTNESVCGLVKGLLEVETTADLFAQYQSIFNDWFDTVKDQVTGDLAIRLQLEFEALDSKVDNYQDDTEEIIAGYNTTYQETLEAAQTAAQLSQSMVANYVNNDYVSELLTFVFTNKVCTISDTKIKASSLIDVYFTADTIDAAEEAEITVDSSVGTITLTANYQPSKNLKGYVRVRVN